MMDIRLIKAVGLIVFIAMGLVSAGVHACDASCKKASSRALKQYGGKVEKAEKKSCVIRPNRSFRLTKRDCEKAIKYLDAKYDRYSDLIRSNPKIADYHARHLKLHDKLANIDKLSLAEETKAMLNKPNNPLGLKKLFD